MASGAVDAPVEIPVVELRSFAVVRQDRVFLSDLLPETASKSLRDAGEELILCTAPLAGHQRQIPQPEIEEALMRFPTLRSQLRIPDRVNVARWSRLLTRQEILGALTKALEEGNLRVAQPLSEDDIRFFSPVAVTEDTPCLKIEGIEAERQKSITHVRIAIASEPLQPPFWVDVDQVIEEAAAVASSVIPPGAPVEADLLRTSFRPAMRPVWSAAQSAPVSPQGISRRAIRAGEAVLAGTLQPAILVRAGQLVQVTAKCDNMNITTTATPLANGYRGDSVRIRSVDNGRVFIGTVIGPQLVEVRF